MGTIYLNRISGSTRLQLRVDYSVTPRIATRDWEIYAELRAKKTNPTEPTTGNSGTFNLNLNGSLVTTTTKYSFDNSDQLVLAHSTTVPETDTGKGTWRLETNYTGYNISGEYFGNIDLPEIDISAPAVNIWISDITTNSAQLNISASHPSYNLTGISWYLDDVLKNSEILNAGSVNKNYAISELEAGSQHIAKVILSAENGKTAVATVGFTVEYLPIQSVDFNDMTIEINRTVKVPISITPEKVSEVPRYSISDTNIATVDAEGYITAVGIGVTEISVICENLTEVRVVKVVEPSEPHYSGRSVIRVFDVFERKFMSGGVGTLLPTVCTVKEVVNGEYSLHIEHPRDKKQKYKRIKKEMVIECPTPRGYDLFRIITVEETAPGIITAEAQHITYDAADNIVFGRSFSGAGSDAVVSLNSFCMNNSDIIDLTSEVRTKAEWTYETKNPVELLLGTDANSFVSVFGGEAYRHRLLFEMRNRIGKNNAFNFAYRKGLKGVTLTEDDSEVITVIVPSGNVSGGGIAISADWAVTADNVNDYPNPKIRNIHFSDVSISSTPTADEINMLKQRAIEKFSEGISKPAVTIQVNIIALETTAEFANFKNLLTLHIGDSGVCRMEDGREFNLRMIEYEYDALRRRYTNIILGTQKASLIDYINKLGE